MDALPIEEATGLPYASKIKMKMLWGKRRGCDTFGAVQQTDGAPHVAIF
jgi:hypothetical protein